MEKWDRQEDDSNNESEATLGAYQEIDK